jgi:hypothetical protein
MAMAGNIEAKSNYSPSFIKAKTPEKLEELMLVTNMKEGKCYHFRDISFANGFWYCWYDKSQQKRIKIQRKNERNS